LPKEQNRLVLEYVGLNGTTIIGECEGNSLSYVLYRAKGMTVEIAPDCVDLYMTDYLTLNQYLLSCSAFSSEVRS